MLRKAMYWAMEADPELEWECYLAEKHGKTPEEIRAMPRSDFVQLVVYYGRKAQRKELELAKAKRR